MEEWSFEFPPDYEFYGDHSPPNVYPFLTPQPPSDEVTKSLQEDRRGWRSANVTGMYFRDENGGIPEAEDEEGRVILPVELWRDAVINGHRWYTSEQAPVVQSWITKQTPAFGGALFEYIPKVLLANRSKPEVGHPTGKYREFFAWSPPPLLNEGHKVQSDWLHDFLLDPYRIRPMVVLRMPKFNMSPDEATKLADYFAARDNATYPYMNNPRRNEAYLARENEKIPGRLEDAFKLVTNKGVCVSCHSLGTFEAQGTPASRAPNLDRVYQRIRPGFLRDWIARPAMLLPYTGMPENIKYGDPKTAKTQFTIKVGPLFSNDADSPHAKQIQSVEQIDALVDMLENFDRYLNQHEKVELNEPPKEKKAEAAEAKAAK